MYVIGKWKKTYIWSGKYKKTDRDFPHSILCASNAFGSGSAYPWNEALLQIPTALTMAAPSWERP